MFPATIAQVSTAQWLQDLSSWFSMGGVIYNLIFVALIVFFCFFYTAIVFDTKDISENLKKQGGFVPGIRPGLKTQEYIDRVLTRITVWGALYISAICVLPQVLMQQFQIPFYFGGTSLLIVVGVSMDFMSQVESQLITNKYEGMLGKTRIRGRNG
jgi:preprotein translocase subunit SecY